MKKISNQTCRNMSKILWKLNIYYNLRSLHCGNSWKVLFAVGWMKTWEACRLSLENKILPRDNKNFLGCLNVDVLINANFKWPNARIISALTRRNSLSCEFINGQTEIAAIVNLNRKISAPTQRSTLNGRGISSTVSTPNSRRVYTILSSLAVAVLAREISPAACRAVPPFN